MQTELLKITGMTCGGCANKVMRILEEVSGVDNVEVSLSAREATVRYDAGMTSPHELKAAVKDAGYGVDPSIAEKLQGNVGCCCS